MVSIDPVSEYPESGGKTILVIDDDPSLGEFIVEALKMEKFCHPLLVRDEIQALETLKTVIPDLLVLDYQIPKINGLELANYFQATEVLKDVPILFMNANIPYKALEERHIASIEKPFGLDELLQAVKKLLSA